MKCINKCELINELSEVPDKGHVFLTHLVVFAARKGNINRHHACTRCRSTEGMRASRLLRRLWQVYAGRAPNTHRDTEER